MGRETTTGRESGVGTPVRVRGPLLALLAAVVVLVTAGAVAGAGPGTAAASTVSPDAGVAAGIDNHSDRPDPDADRLGWESVNGHGVWYNESIPVDPSDGLNDTELDRMVARTMARVEHVRELEFRSAVPVAVITRETHAERTARFFENLSDRQRLRQNVKFEAMLAIGEETDAVGELRGARTGAVLGYYDFEANRITLVSDRERPTVDEVTLAQELTHALQDQRFDPTNESWYPGETSEASNTAGAVIEGDANYVTYLYAGRCRTEWRCLRPELPGDGGGGSTNAGVSLLQAYPYSDGPAFVRDRHERAGWAAVDRLYDRPPESTEQVIHPERYLEDSPTEVQVPDRSGDGWRRLSVDGVDRLEYGEAGLAAMLAYPAFDGDARSVLVSRDQFLTGEALGPYNYAFEPTTGWDGDALYPYVTDDSAETNETGYVWRSVWDSTEDAEQFADAYRMLLAYNGARVVTSREDTWRIPEDRNDLADAFYVTVNDTRVTIVNAPTVEDLSAVHAGASPRAEVTATPTATTTVTPTRTATATATTTDRPSTTDDRGLPGVGVVGAVLAVVVALVALARRRG